MEKEILTRILYYGDLSPDSKQFIQNLVDKKDKEIERLNNIIDELEKWLDKKEKLTFNSWNKGIHEVQRKLQELKEGK